MYHVDILAGGRKEEHRSKGFCNWRQASGTSQLWLSLKSMRQGVWWNEQRFLRAERCASKRVQMIAIVGPGKALVWRGDIFTLPKKVRFQATQAVTYKTEALSCCNPLFGWFNQKEAHNKIRTWVALTFLLLCLMLLQGDHQNVPSASKTGAPKFVAQFQNWRALDLCPGESISKLEQVSGLGRQPSSTCPKLGCCPISSIQIRCYSDLHRLPLQIWILWS
jgi:hypothetical protein